MLKACGFSLSALKLAESILEACTVSESPFSIRLKLLEALELQRERFV